MKKIFILLILVLALTSCGKNTIEDNVVNTIENVETDLTGIKAEEEEEVEEKIEALDEDVSDKIFSQLTGLEITEAQSHIRPIAVMLDNQFKARPQAGLSEAEVVYEILAEGSITRYMAIYQVNKPEVIGPVRSSRPYYIERALEFNPIYVHVGGSMQALTDIINYKMGDIDGLSVGAGVFYRTDHKYMPHNAYTSHDGIRKEAKRKGHYEEVEFAGMPISHQAYTLVGKPANRVQIQYKKSSANDAKGYSVLFDYDDESKKYFRYVNDEAHLDEASKIHLQADNIIIQKVSHEVIDDVGRKKLKMIGKGYGSYVNKGVSIDITWEKSGPYEQTKYYYMDGKALMLNPGITWVQVIPTNVNPYLE